MNGRSLSRCTLHHNVSSALSDDPIYGCQAESRSLARVLCRKERLENLNLGRAIHSASCVYDGKPDQRPGFRQNVTRLDAQQTTVPHRVAAVHDKVHDHLLNLAGIDLDAPQGRIELRFQPDVLSDQSAEHLEHLAHCAVQIENSGSNNLFAAEGEELAG